MSSADAAREGLWAESVHRHNERWRADMRAAWCSYHWATERDHRQRVEEVLEAIGKGAAEKMWSTYWEVSELAWDHMRECWVDGDGIAYDGERFHDYSLPRGEEVSVNEHLPRN
jgi:hypothetical protein